MSDTITFVAHQRPGLPSGDYEITVTQRVSLDTDPFPATRTFTVTGERFALPPAAVRGVFPPDGSLGDHTTVLPHLVLDRPTLPWERRPGGSDDVTGPWLVLLLFSGDERPEPTPVTRGTLTAGPAYIPAPAAEKHERPDDPITVIDVPRTLLADIMPHPDDLDYLAHVRRTDDDTAVVIGTRLPPPGESCTVHLVSVEGRCTSAGFDLGPPGGGALVRLVTLASWQFACLAKEQTFPYLARALAGRGRPFRLPDSGDPRADAFLAQGQVPVRHALRQGGRTVSWYRGPFVTGPAPAPPPAAAVRTPDALLRYYNDTGMLGTGYAAAWQLGRLIALQHSNVATALYGWKRRRAQLLKRDVAADHPLSVPDIDVDVPSGVQALFDDLARLRGVPLRYLIPDERLLPVETIRFLQLDPQWIAALIDGAYSIGRLTRADAELDRRHPPAVELPPISGALIRSDLVPGYPSMLIDAYADPGGTTSVPPARTERLTPAVLLCLFEGEIARLDLHQHPEAQHFAVERPAAGRIGKTLRGGAEINPLPLGPGDTVPVRTLAGRLAGLLDMPADTFSSADFALQMIETAERVTFLRSAPP
jgi:hypothetical protein